MATWLPRSPRVYFDSMDRCSGPDLKKQILAFANNQPADLFSYAVFSGSAGPAELKATLSPTEFKRTIISQQLADGALAVILVRHGRSVANERNKIRETPELVSDLKNFANHQMPLTDIGISQAEATGRYLADMVQKGILPSIDTVLYSPYQRTQETLQHLLGGLRGYCAEKNLSIASFLEGGEGAKVGQSNIVRERFWGDFETLSDTEQEREYSCRTQQPFDWVPQGNKPGETIAEVSDRASQFMGVMHRKEFAGRVVLVVTHGEFMNAVELNVRRLSPFNEDFVQSFERGIPNCGIMMISKVAFAPEMPPPTQPLKGFSFESRVVPYDMSQREAGKYRDWLEPTWKPLPKQTRYTLGTFQAADLPTDIKDFAGRVRSKGIGTGRVIPRA